MSTLCICNYLQCRFCYTREMILYLPLMISICPMFKYMLWHILIWVNPIYLESFLATYRWYIECLVWLLISAAFARVAVIHLGRANILGFSLSQSLCYFLICPRYLEFSTLIFHFHVSLCMPCLHSVTFDSAFGIYCFLPAIFWGRGARPGRPSKVAERWAATHLHSSIRELFKYKPHLFS